MLQAVNNNNNQAKKPKDLPKVDREWFRADVERVTANNSAHVRELVNSIIAQDNTYVFPRPITTAVNSNRYKFTQDITISAAEAADPLKCRVAIKMRPEPNRILSIGRSIDSFTVDAGDYRLPTNVNDADLVGEVVSLPIKLSLNGGTSYIYPEYDSNLPSKVQSPGLVPLIPGGYVIPCSTTTTAPTTFNVKISNGDPDSLTFSVTMTAYSGSLGSLVALSPTMSSTTTAIASGGAVTVDWAAVSPGFANFWAQLATATHVGITINQSGTKEYKLDSIKIDLNTSAFVLDAGFRWTNYSLWDLVPDSDDIRNIFNKANSYSITGMNCIFQNNTPELSKGGTVYAARLPGGSELRLPTSFDKMQNVLRNIKDNNFKETNLDRGLFWYYTPEKATDLFFEDVSENGRRPYAGITFTVPSGISGSFVLTLVGIINMELITYNPALTMMRSIASEPLMSCLCAALSELPGWSHNPNHLQHISQAVKSVMNNDQVKMVLKSMVQAGVKLAPMVIAALA